MNNLKKFGIPEMAKGTIVPNVIYKMEKEEALRKKAERKARIYFWGGIISTALFTFVGFFLGKYFG